MSLKKKAILAVVGGVAMVLLSAGAAVAETGSQTFVLFDQGDETRVVAVGPIRGFGTDIVVSEEFDEATGTFVSEDILRFPEGDVFTTFSGSASEFDFDPVTCIGRFDGTADYEITGGTGAYEGASGTGSGTFMGLFVGGRNPDGSCSEEEDDEVASVFFARVSGTSTVPDGQAAAA